MRGKEKAPRGARKWSGTSQGNRGMANRARQRKNAERADPPPTVRACQMERPTHRARGRGTRAPTHDQQHERPASRRSPTARAGRGSAQKKRRQKTYPAPAVCTRTGLAGEPRRRKVDGAHRLVGEEPRARRRHPPGDPDDRATGGQQRAGGGGGSSAPAGSTTKSSTQNGARQSVPRPPRAASHHARADRRAPHAPLANHTPSSAANPQRLGSVPPPQRVHAMTAPSSRLSPPPLSPTERVPPPRPPPPPPPAR